MFYYIPIPFCTLISLLQMKRLASLCLINHSLQHLPATHITHFILLVGWQISELIMVKIHERPPYIQSGMLRDQFLKSIMENLSYLVVSAIQFQDVATSENKFQENVQT